MQLKGPSTLYFAPDGKYLWDPWFMGIQDQTHCFFLQSPRDGDPDARHHNRVSVGHAVSKDLYHWDYRGTILSPGEEGCWDDLSIWTGFMLNYAGQYYLFYTGRGQENF